MTSSRKTALAVGVLFILTFITSIAGVIAYVTILSDPLYIVGAGSNTGVFMGAFLELLLIITNIGCAVVLFPLLKRQNEGLALGYVTARLVECGFIAVGLLSLLTVATLQGQTASANAESLVPIGKSLVAMHNWTFLLGPGFADGIGTGLILGWLMYRSGLVGRRMALVGVVGGVMLATSGLLALLVALGIGGLPRPCQNATCAAQMRCTSASKRSPSKVGHAPATTSSSAWRTAARASTWTPSRSWPRA